jgi:PAS domain S-box-containing protein
LKIEGICLFPQVFSLLKAGILRPQNNQTMCGKETAAANTGSEKAVDGRAAITHQYADSICDNIYHFVFEQATDAIMVSDFNGNLVDVNSSLCAMFGYTKDELLRINVRALIEKEHLQSEPLRFDLLAAGKNLFTERKMIHKNGTVIYVEANSKKIMDNRILVIARDISRLKNADSIIKKSEAHLHTIFDTTDTIYVLMDHDLRVMSYNQQARAFASNELGFSIEVSEYFLDYFPAEKRPQLLAHMKAALSGKHISYEVSYLQAGGSVNWYYVRLFPISKGDNNVYGLMMAVSDISEKRALEQKLEEERLKKQLEITDAVITAEENERQHISRELHDNVTQLLATARMYVGFAKQSGGIKSLPIMTETDKFIEAAITEIRNLSHSLVSPLLNQFGLFDSLNYLAATFSKASGLVIKTEMEFDEDALEHKLKLTIYRITQEQLNNIVKHARARTIHLELLQVRNKISLRIKDDGAGFECSLKGNGIGLMNIRTRASLFNGKVDIISSPGNGCELLVNFN